MKGIDRVKHNQLLQALHELLDLTDNPSEARCIESDIATLNTSYDDYQTLLEQLREAVIGYDVLHGAIRHRTCRSLRTLRCSVRRNNVAYNQRIQVVVQPEPSRLISDVAAQPEITAVTVPVPFPIAVRNPV